MSLAATGAGVKNLAIGVGIIAGVGLVLYVFWKGRAVVTAAAKGVEDAAGYIFASDSAPRTLATDAFDFFHPGDVLNAPAQIDEVQAIKTCNIAWATNGRLKSAICQRLQAEGKLTPP